MSDLTTLRDLLARVEAATAYDEALERDLLAVLGPMQRPEFQRPTQRLRSWDNASVLVATLSGLSLEDSAAVHSQQVGDGPPGYVLAASLLRRLIEKGERGCLTLS